MTTLWTSFSLRHSKRKSFLPSRLSQNKNREKKSVTTRKPSCSFGDLLKIGTWKETRIGHGQLILKRLTCTKKSSLTVLPTFFYLDWHLIDFLSYSFLVSSKTVDQIQFYLIKFLELSIFKSISTFRNSLLHTGVKIYIWSKN